VIRLSFPAGGPLDIQGRAQLTPEVACWLQRVCSGNVKFVNLVEKNGAPGAIPTRDLPLRRWIHKFVFNSYGKVRETTFTSADPE
jgi:hypothetical protein